MELIKSTEYTPPSERNMNGHYNHNLSHQKQGCGRTHEREWEPSVNGRAKHRAPVPTLTRTVQDAKRDKTDRKTTRTPDVRTPVVMDPPPEKALARPHGALQRTTSKSKGSHVYQNQRMQKPMPSVVRGVAGYQTSTACYVGAGLTLNDTGVFGVYSETKYTFAVNGLPGNPAQASAAAAFFAR